MDQREYGDHAALQDAAWRRRLRASAQADVKAMLRGSRRRKLERWLVTSMVLVAVIAVVMLLIGVGVFDRGKGAPNGGGPGEGPNAQHVVDLNRPFAQTPAEHWADGAAGIEAPPAMQVGEFSAAEVANVTAKVKDLLVASRLDPTMLRDHNPDRYLGLLAPDVARQLRPLFGNGNERQVQALVSMLDNGAQLLPATPKVKGAMRVEAGKVGELVVHTNYVFAYAFTADKVDLPLDPMSVVVVVRADIEYVMRKGPRWAPGSLGLWYEKVDGFFYSISCDSYRKGFISSDYRDRAPGRNQAKHDRVTYFDPEADIPLESGCPN
ncbi:hypothetical protein [Actinokineospora diospyrosa]|uniref:LppA-like lipoprotein n=1 Tax=Actinokineospora diospyrosa TaxID=103728 RepID=A0ABT1IAQ6_9PSEU|nr:hypothetical protein [Actinokineospora diospyrosa]MCP2269705.1 hypothetical protein [Actinokineospora diospyrosa]